jgi:hypothetical protein
MSAENLDTAGVLTFLVETMERTTTRGGREGEGEGEGEGETCKECEGLRETKGERRRRAEGERENSRDGGRNMGAWIFKGKEVWGVGRKVGGWRERERK